MQAKDTVPVKGEEMKKESHDQQTCFRDFFKQ